MKILITGINGYLGSQLANRLVVNHSLMGTVRSNSNLSRLNSLDKIILANVEEDNYIKLIKKFKPDIVINTVTSYGRQNENLTQLYESNVIFPLVVLENIELDNKVTFINCGTSLPKEVNAYSLTKYHFSEIGKFYSMEKKIQFIDLKLEHFFGIGDDELKFTNYLINNCIKNIDLKLTECTQERDFIYIKDLLDAFDILILKCKELNLYEKIDIGTGVSLQLKKLVELVAKLTNYTGNINFGAIATRQNEVMKSTADISKIKSLGWNPKYCLEFAIKEIINEISKSQ